MRAFLFIEGLKLNPPRARVLPSHYENPSLYIPLANVDNAEKLCARAERKRLSFLRSRSSGPTLDSFEAEARP
jgi:hypothetical protein